MYENFTTEELEARLARIEELERRQKVIARLAAKESNNNLTGQPSPIMAMDLTSDIEICHSEQAKKKQKQPNILQGFNLSASFTNKSGVTKVLTPAIVREDRDIHEFRCSHCKERFGNRGGLVRHEMGRCHMLLTPVSILAKPGKSGNRGSKTRKGYTHQQKMRAVLFYNSMEPNTTGAVAEFCRQTGWPQSTVQKWLKNAETRRNITKEWVHSAQGTFTLYSTVYSTVHSYILYSTLILYILYILYTT